MRGRLRVGGGRELSEGLYRGVWEKVGVSCIHSPFMGKFTHCPRI